MKRIIDLHTWERKEEFGFFCDFINPYVNVTCHVDCRTAKASAHKDKASLFLYYLYAILKAVNEIPELRHRIDVDGNIVEYNRIDVLTPIMPQSGKGFVTMCFPYRENCEDFCRHAFKLIDECLMRAQLAQNHLAENSMSC